MIHDGQIKEPLNRGKLRKKLGREYFIAKRQLHWLLGKERYAKAAPHLSLPHSLIKHKSLLLRPLKDVDMYLQHNKVKNLELAIRHLNQVVIHPGECFSFWRLVGRPTEKKGYLEGLALHNGKIGKDIGGGLCQLGNLIYWMALHSPLKVKERWRHGYDVFPDVNRRIPFGCGATLAYNYIDLQLENPTQMSFQLKFFLSESHLHGEITSSSKLSTRYEIYETDHAFIQQWWGGHTRQNKIWRSIEEPRSKETQIELITENQAIMMYNPLVEY